MISAWARTYPRENVRGHAARRKKESEREMERGWSKSENPTSGVCRAKSLYFPGASRRSLIKALAERNQQEPH